MSLAGRYVRRPRRGTHDDFEALLKSVQDGFPDDDYERAYDKVLQIGQHRKKILQIGQHRKKIMRAYVKRAKQLKQDDNLMRWFAFFIRG